MERKGKHYNADGSLRPKKRRTGPILVAQMKINRRKAMAARFIDTAAETDERSRKRSIEWADRSAGRMEQAFLELDMAYSHMQAAERKMLLAYKAEAKSASYMRGMNDLDTAKLDEIYMYLLNYSDTVSHAVNMIATRRMSNLKKIGTVRGGFSMAGLTVLVLTRYMVIFSIPRLYYIFGISRKQARVCYSRIAMRMVKEGFLQSVGEASPSKAQYILTPEGEALVDEYEAMCADIRDDGAKGVSKLTSIDFKRIKPAHVAEVINTRWERRKAELKTLSMRYAGVRFVKGSHQNSNDGTQHTQVRPEPDEDI